FGLALVYRRHMSTHVVILGAGFGGLELATRLSDSASDEIRVTLIDRNDSFSFGFSKLDVLLGRKTISEVLLPYDEIEKDGVKFPPAPFEGAFLLHDRFVERGIRHAVEIRVIGPQSAPVPVTKEVSRNFLDALAERGIEYVPNQHFVELDTNGKEARLEGGGTA